MSKPHKIEALFAYIVTHPNGEEGVPAFDGGNGLVFPMVGSDPERMQSLRPTAQSIASMHGLPIKLVRFSGVEIVEVISAGQAGHA